MNPLIKNQLSKLGGALVPPFEDTTTSLVIAKRDNNIDTGTLKEDVCYLISVEDYILNPPEGFTLHTNWNNNTAPKHKFMKIEVNKVMGKMVKVYSLGYDMKNGVDTSDLWTGWLPQKSITIIERL